MLSMHEADNYRFLIVGETMKELTFITLRDDPSLKDTLVTDHTGFYERYGWEFLCMVQEDADLQMTRMYIHR